MATQLASQHQPVRVIRGAGSTPPIARPGPGSQGRQPRPARRPGKALPQHPAIGIQMRTTQPPATERRPERPGLARNHTTIPTARSSHGAWPGWRVAHPIRSDQAAVPGHTHGSPARQIKPIWMQSPASGTQQLGMQNGYTRLAPVLGPITDGEEEHPSSGARSPIRCLSSEPALSDAVRPEDRFWRAWYVQFVHRGLLMTSASWVRDLIWSLR